jgi:DDE family transposase
LSNGGWDKKKKRKVNWSEYNESLVKRGEVLFDTDFLSNWRIELKEMNKGKEGAKYLYPNSLILLLAAIHAYLLPYRQLEGFLRVMTTHIKELKEDEVPDYTTVWWRVVRVKVQELNPEVNPEDTITIAVDIRTKHIVSMKVTKEDVSDSRMLKPLIRLAASSSITTINKVVADGAYDSRDNFRYLDQMNIEPVIKVRKNSSTKANGCMSRKLVVLEQLRDMKRWKKKHGYGMRWIAESAFSSIKRIFGEYVASVKWDNIVNELLLKAYIYNVFIGKATT